MRPLLRTVSFVAVAAAVSLGAGCKSSCRQLSEKLCDCATSSVDKENCISNAQRLEQNANVTDADNQKCAELLPKCDCHNIDTAEGKIACGLARQPDGGQ